jgi:hypothetical protein
MRLPPLGVSDSFMVTIRERLRLEDHIFTEWYSFFVFCQEISFGLAKTPDLS